MKKESMQLLAVFLVALAMSAGCKKGADSPGLSNIGPSSAATSTVLPRGNPPCPGGGIGIYTGSDTNGNGVLEASEVQRGVPICDPLTDDGIPGGLVSLVMIASEPTGTLHCPAGGLKVLSGPDANRNGVLDAQEIAFTEYLCNGTPGSGSAAGITVAVAPQSAPSSPGDRKKVKKPAPSKRPDAASGKAPGKAAGKTATEEKDKPAEPVAPAKKDKEKGGSARPAVQQGWNTVKTGSPQLASVAYKIEGQYITVRFQNLSAASALRFKYTVRWKMKQNGGWVDDSSTEGLTVRLKPQESLDKEVRAQARDIKDVVVDLDVVETN